MGKNKFKKAQGNLENKAIEASIRAFKNICLTTGKILIQKQRATCALFTILPNPPPL